MIEHNPAADDVNVAAVVKGVERYVFFFRDADQAAALEVMGRFASNPELSFTWFDAAVMSRKIRADAQEQKPRFL